MQLQSLTLTPGNPLTGFKKLRSVKLLATSSRSRLREKSILLLHLGGAAVHRCDKSLVLIWASAPEVRLGKLFSR